MMMKTNTKMTNKDTKRKPKILLISDDIRFPTGVGTMSKVIVENTKDKIEWVQIGGARFHPNANTVDNVNGTKVYAVSEGYGRPEQFTEVLNNEKPDGILFFTDPRYFIQHFYMEDTIRKTTPFMFYTIWDNYPLPLYNIGFYESCDGLFCITKQTKSIVEGVLNHYGQMNENRVISYVPHGIESNIFRHIPLENIPVKFQKQVFEGKVRKDYKYVYLWSNKNMSRKRPSDVLVAFDEFVKSNNIQSESVLLMNTMAYDFNGTNLYKIKSDILDSKTNVIFLNGQSFPREELPMLYNLADVTICNSDAEGHGLSVTESLLCETSIIATVTGGLQEQMGIEPDLNGISRNLTKQVQRYSDELSRNTDIPNISSVGKWSYPLFPDSTNLIGSVTTPYIYEDRTAIMQLVNQLNHTLQDYENLPIFGKTGRNWMIKNNFTSEKMCQGIVESIYKTLSTFKNRNQNRLIKI
jgi:hypothetical protein